MRLYDAHCHLQDPRLEGVVSDFLRQARDFGIRRVVVNGTCPADWERVAKLARASDVVLPSFGLHPWKVSDVEAGWQEQLECYLEAFPEAGIGEVGLDRWIMDYDIEAQRAAFEWQVDLARSKGRPVSVHCLKAWGVLLECIERLDMNDVRYLLHSYGGSKELVDALAKKGAYFSISGYFAQKRKKNLWPALRAIPEDRLLIETDAPDMAGPTEICEYSVSGDAKANHPRNVEGVYRFVARLRGVGEAPLARQVEANFERLFMGSS